MAMQPTHSAELTLRSLSFWHAGRLQAFQLGQTAKKAPSNKQPGSLVEASDDRAKPRWHCPNWPQQGSRGCDLSC